MLDDQDRRTLEALERRLVRSDPEFAARMRGTPSGSRLPRVSLVCLLLFAAVPVMSLLFGPRIALVTILIGPVALAAIGLVARRRARRR